MPLNALYPLNISAAYTVHILFRFPSSQNLIVSLRVSEKKVSQSENNIKTAYWKKLSPSMKGRKSPRQLNLHEANEYVNSTFHQVSEYLLKAVGSLDNLSLQPASIE